MSGEHLAGWPFANVSYWFDLLMHSRALKTTVCTSFLVHCPYWCRQDINPHSIPPHFPQSFTKPNAIHTQKLTNLYISTLKMEAACTSELLATCPHPHGGTTQEQNQHQCHSLFCWWHILWLTSANKKQRKEMARNRIEDCGKKEVTGAPSSVDPYKIKTMLK